VGEGVILLRRGNGELSERLRGVIAVLQLSLLGCVFVCTLDDVDLAMGALLLLVATARSTCNTLDPLALDDVVGAAFTAAALESLSVSIDVADSDVLERVVDDDLSLFLED